MQKLFFTTLFLALFTTQFFAQNKSKPAGQLSPQAIEKIHAAEDTLAILAYAVVNDSLEQVRFGACHSLITALVRTLKTENSFNYPFERLKTVSILYPADSSFRIFTWQLFVNDSTYRYYGAIQLNTSELRLFPLIDRSNDMSFTPTHEALQPDNWYGAVYYTIRDFDTREGRKYLLCGFDAFEFFEKRKVIEVLSFGKDGKPVFGAPVFDRDRQPGKMPQAGEMRIFLQYSAEASVRCNWDEQYGLVIYDHLEPTPSPFGRGTTFIPDGSVEGLKLEKGRWKHISKVFNDAMDAPPFPEPVLDKRAGKNVLGKDKKKSGW